jgi:hypothetical protein
MHVLLTSLLLLPAAIAQDVYGADVKPTTTSTPGLADIPDVPIPEGYASFNGTNPEEVPCTQESTITITLPNNQPTDLPGHLYTPIFPGEPEPSDVAEPQTTDSPPSVTDAPEEPEETTTCDDSTTTTPTETPSDKPCPCEDKPTTFETTTSPPIVTGTGTGAPTYTNTTNGTYNSPTPPLVTNTEVVIPTSNGSVTVPNGPSPTTTGDPLFTDAATALERWSSAGLVAAIVGVIFVGL